MKKTYSKPDILFESFSLSTSIAAGCEVKITTIAAKQCGMKFGDTVVFTADMGNVCSTKVVDGSLYDGLCYHVPTESNNLFNS